MFGEPLAKLLHWKDVMAFATDTFILLVVPRLVGVLLRVLRLILWLGQGR